ncbi:MAG: LamG domain-containing protein, partial [Gammaproteobacteria bacterium]
SDCAQNAQMMEDAITAMAANITPTQIDPSFITSKALTLYDGTIASGGNRYETSQIALWEFKAGQGATAFDTSGVDPAIDLTLSGDVEWVGGWGINVKDGKAQGTTATSKKLHDLIKGTGEYSIEAWVAPGNVTQEDARIVSYTGGPMARNFSLSQTLYNYDYLNRSSATDAEGNPMFSTPDADEVLQATLQHVVVTFDPVDGRKIYVNGQLVADMDPAGGGTLTDWDDTFAFVLGNEVSNDGLWMGVMRMVAIHNRVLTPAQIQQNLDVGVGEKFFLLFSVEHLINVPQSYIMLEGAQFDSYGYLFNTPTFISLDPTATPGSIPLQKMRVGINGQEAPVGQAYKPLDTVITDAAYTPTGMQQLASIGTVIPLEKGPDSDEFFLTFELLGGNSAPRVEPPPVIPPPPPDDPPVSDIGVKTFDEINASMSQATTISMMNSNVQATYQKVKQSLPAVETIEAFAAPQQMAVAQLSIEYCNALVDDTGARATYFPTFTGFNTNPNNPAAAFGVAPNAQRDAVLDPLITSVMNTNLGSQPSAANVKAELNNLIDRLVPCSGAACIGRTATIVKAVCSAAVGSGGLTVQ